jgi:hypothetical protein
MHADAYLDNGQIKQAADLLKDVVIVEERILAKEAP